MVPTGNTSLNGGYYDLCEPCWKDYKMWVSAFIHTQPAKGVHAS